MLPTSPPIEIRRPHLVVTIDGQLIDAVEADSHCGVDRTVGRATVSAIVPAYTATQLRDRWINRPIEIQAGYAERGGAVRIFAGRVASLDREWTGTMDLTIRATGWAKILDWKSEQDLWFPGGTTLYEIARALCTLRGVPQFGGEPITYLDGVTPVRLGGVAEIDGGRVKVPKRTSWLQWLSQKLRLVAYRIFDREDGYVWWQRVNGQLAADPVMAFAQADNVVSMGREDDVDGVVTWWDVEGARYTDADGIDVQIRSFPVSVPPFPFPAPPEFIRDEIRDSVLTTEALADLARNAAELDTSGPYELDRWAFLGEPSVRSGQVVSLTAPTLELADARRWVMSTDHHFSDRGMTTDWTGWAGTGSPVPGGDDEDEIPVVTGPVHVGDENLWHYAHPANQGKVISFPITVPETYTAIWLEGWFHGVNSYLLGGVNTDSEVSKVEVHQDQGQDDPTKPVGSATLPVMPENLANRFPYNQLPTTANKRHWEFRRIPVPGRLEPGTATVKLVSGEDRKIGAAFRFDDFEGYGLVLKVSGVGYPTLPGGAP